MKRILILSMLITIMTANVIHAGTMEFGTTFSPRQCRYLELDWKETYLAIMDMPLDLIRLGAYWDEIEKKKNEFDFSKLDWLIGEARQRGVSVVLVVGMKSPRWPEYHIPDWVSQKVRLGSWQVVSKHAYLRERTLNFIRNVVERYKNEETIEELISQYKKEDYAR